MITFTYIEILQITLVVFTLIILNNLQFALKPADYFSVRSIVVNLSSDRVTKSTFIKILVTIVVSVYFSYLIGYSNKVIFLGFVIKEFLQIWVAICQLKICNKWNKFKVIYFLACMGYFVSSLFYAFWSLKQFIPAITNGVPFIIISNEAVNFVITLVLYIVPLPLNYHLISKKLNVKYTDIESLHADTIVVMNQIDDERQFIDEYSFEIEKYAEENNIPKELLEGILCLEYTNRGSIFNRILERFMVKISKRFVITKDFSIGLAQIKPSTAKALLKKSPYEFIDKMLNNDFSIQLCAKLLRRILDDYEKEVMNALECDYFFDENIWCFIASQYLCGFNTSYRRNTLIYESILATMCKEANIESYIEQQIYC